MSDYTRFFDLFARDTKGSNFREYVQTIDYGYGEFWSVGFHIQEWGVGFYTQYNPPIRCTEELCHHFPRNHLDDVLVDLDGIVVEDGADMV